MVQVVWWCGTAGLLGGSGRWSVRWGLGWGLGSSLRWSLRWGLGSSGSHAEVLEELGGAGLEGRVVERLHDPALREQVVAVGDGGGERDVLLDEEHRDALVLD